MTDPQQNTFSGRAAGRMKAMRIHTTGQLDDGYSGMQLDWIPVPQAATGDVLVRVRYCGVCHTELDEIENRAEPAFLPIIPGHQVVGTVVAEGPGCQLGLLGQSVGVAWIYSSCGECRFCQSGRENLCPSFMATGKDKNGGYAEYMAVPERFVHPIPAGIELAQVAPLLCAGAVGFRALAMAQLDTSKNLGLTGFGASGQLVLRMARALYPHCPLYVFARSSVERQLAMQLGAEWSGDTADRPPVPLSAIIDTTPAWRPVLAALDRLDAGGVLIINAIRKESNDQALLADLDYTRQLWREKAIRTVANVTRKDVRDMLDLATNHAIAADVTELPLEEALLALKSIKAGHISRARVLRVQAGE